MITKEPRKKRFLLDILPLFFYPHSILVLVDQSIQGSLVSVKIRLKRVGRKKAPFYHFVVADSRAPRDGRFIEKLGTYNPQTKEKKFDQEKMELWQKKGALPTEVVAKLIKV